MRLLPQVGLTPDHATLLMAHLARADYRDGFASAFAGEAAMVEVVFESPAEMGFSAEPADPVSNAWARIYQSGAAAPLRAADESTALEILAQIQAIGALPLFEARPQLEAVEQRIEGLSQLLHPMSLVMLPSLTRAGEAQARHEAMLDLAQLGLAVEQFHAGTGAYPESLAEIADLLADGVPVDPFTGEPYAYRTTDDGFLLYSVGRNLTDDGGTHDLREGDIVWRGVVQPKDD